MPGLDGHAVIEALKVLHADVPIIAVSSGGAREKDELLLEAVRLGGPDELPTTSRPSRPASRIATLKERCRHP